MTRSGRPKSANPKSIRFEIRLTEAEAINLQNYAVRLNTNRTGVLMLGFKLMQSGKEVKPMIAEEARRISEQGAIRAIEAMIEREANKGRRNLELSGTAVEDSFTENIQSYFENNGFDVNGSIISW